jgi:acyl carrier protein
MTDSNLAVVGLVIARQLEVEPRTFARDALLAEDLGLDSLDVILVALRLEEILGVDVAIADLERVRTVGELAEFVRVAPPSSIAARLGFEDVVRPLPTIS